MTTLDEIGLRNRTDKSSSKHNYTKLYAAYFDTLRERSLSILEIGAANGYSLKMWKEYFQHAKIVGVDIEDCKELEEDRIAIEVGNQGDITFLQHLNEQHGPFDIIIDDGSHINVDMKISFDFLFPLLAPGGIYVVEDLHMCYWGKTHNAGEPVFIDRLKELLDLVNSSGKSGTANHVLDHKDPYHLNNKTELSWWEDSIEFLHLYRSIVFIKKYPIENQESTYIINIPQLFYRGRRKFRVIWRGLKEVKWARKKTERQI